jgi:hypothetical protein
MSEKEERVNEEQTQVEQPTQRTVSAVSVLLSAVELAQSRGAFKVNEMQLISQAHSLVSQQEAKNAPQQPQEQSTVNTDEKSE